MRIHALQTGTVRVKPSQRVGRGRGSIRQLNILLDRSWTESLPIYAWAIETVDGVIIVDTGETAQTREPGYFPRWHPYFRLAVRLDVTPEQEVGPQLLKIGIRPEDVRTVILTHLHTDHAGGLHHFPKSEILVCDEELRLAKGFAGRLRGYLPNRWPEWFAPSSITFEEIAFGPFARSRRVTTDANVVIVPTPGHIPGHVSVIAMDGDVSYFLAGDTSYTQQLLIEQRVDGVSPDEAVALRTLQTICRYAEERAMVHLPTHDPQSGERLSSRATHVIPERGRS
ncbi:MAG TPA: N-acyl homoserine lactonase family protein [Candidatus Acidoferrum sp.]|nr:N-acyl homoserine lactonase family protein [Candidatus Acidoferrum sp.]